MRDSEIKTLFAKADEQVHVDEIRKQKTYHAMIEEMEKQRTPMMSIKNILFHQFWYMDKLFFGKMAEFFYIHYFHFYVVCVSQFSLMLDDIWFEGI